MKVQNTIHRVICEIDKHVLIDTKLASCFVINYIMFISVNALNNR